MVRVGGHGTGRLWRIALLTLAGATGTACEADAAVYYWSGYDPSYYYYQPPTALQRRPRVRRYQAKKMEAPEKESTKPQGPLIIAISIEKQSLKLYDANGFFAETPISTGMRGHPTPMGVFSIIQKHKFHHSNIYSGAPMPYMQRITWSGVAMHAGVLPGYPASHGCIRMPMAFAVKMWNWTKMGARVIVTPGEITPASFSHPLLAPKTVVPKPEAAANESVNAEGKPESIKAGTDISPGAPDVKQDQAPAPDKKAVVPKPDPAANPTTPKRAGQIAALISRKDSRLYVRQNFSALFDVPVTIASSDRPLGTHVFTVRVDKDDASVLRWSVVSLPAPARDVERHYEDERALRRRKIAGAVEVKALPAANSPAEALDRLSIPADAMARITEALSTGGSIIVSDQGISAGETGEGTDFIVSLR